MTVTRQETPAASLPETGTGDGKVNIAEQLTAMAVRYPDKRAVVWTAGRDASGRARYAHVTFAELDQETDRFQHARACGFLALHGAASEDAVLLRAGIERARGIVCAVDSDSENIVITLGARELNPDILIVSRADDEGAVQKIKRAGASHVVSPALRGGADIADLLIQPHLGSSFSKRSCMTRRHSRRNSPSVSRRDLISRFVG